MNKFQVGQKVTRIAFVDCFGKQIPAVSNLIVEGVELVECQSMPSYYRIKAVDGKGGYEEGAERFFVRKPEIETMLNNIIIYRPTCQDAMFISVLVRHSWNAAHTMSAVAQFVRPFTAAVTPENILVAVAVAIADSNIFKTYPDAAVADVEIMTYAVTPRQQVAYAF